MPDEPSLELPSLFRRKKRKPSPVEEERTPDPPLVEATPTPPVPAPQVEERRAPAPPLVEERPTPAPPLVEGGRSPVTKPRGLRLPQVAPLPAAILTGAAVGLLTSGLVWLALRGCSSLRGTSTCGDPGFFVLLAIFVLMVLAGRYALTALGVSDAGSTAFLGMALVAVLALLFVDDLGSVVSAVVLAVVAAATFGLSQWLTSAFTEPGERPR